ncbi:hypothetical protein QA584_22740 [Anaerocolumna sp. AGMB13025]|uniref:hypothetical protein n=1 Tax=Anaerocolumna sp. AGMB13025 TaxID=3039116 RepID=UPI00241F5473|nr:hypothetical protein [Anaerocolumna sp. AGMB13025]WFR56402.1 hypothetical protein QA584_22740 [Anaerocolumna sp. AGMB13025]
MPFFEIDKTPELNIDFSRCQPVSVIAAFNPQGEFKPVHFGLMDLYGNVCKVKVTGIKNTKDVRGGKSFICTYMAGDQERECILTYYLDKHLWVLGN